MLSCLALVFVQEWKACINGAKEARRQQTQQQQQQHHMPEGELQSEEPPGEPLRQQQPSPLQQQTDAPQQPQSQQQQQQQPSPLQQQQQQHNPGSPLGQGEGQQQPQQQQPDAPQQSQQQQQQQPQQQQQQQEQSFESQQAVGAGRQQAWQASMSAEDHDNAVTELEMTAARHGSECYTILLTPELAQAALQIGQALYGEGLLHRVPAMDVQGSADDAVQRFCEYADQAKAVGQQLLGRVGQIHIELRVMQQQQHSMYALVQHQGAGLQQAHLQLNLVAQQNNQILGLLQQQQQQQQQQAMAMLLSHQHMVQMIQTIAQQHASLQMGVTDLATSAARWGPGTSSRFLPAAGVGRGMAANAAAAAAATTAGYNMQRPSSGSAAAAAAQGTGSQGGVPSVGREGANISQSWLQQGKALESWPGKIEQLSGE
jgi:hypothetical protein